MSMPESIEGCVVDAAKNIESKLANLSNPLKEELTDWVTNHGLGRANDAEVIVARQTTFNVLLKACLHRTYQQQGDPLPTFEADRYVDVIEETAANTGDRTLRPYLLDRLANRLPPNNLKRLWEAGGRLFDADNPAETIGRIHEQLVPQKDRRKLGQFRTPPTVAELMATWVIREADDSVLDPGIGGGVLSVNAYQAKRECGGSSLDEIRGIDVSELSVLMGNTSLRLADGDSHPDLKNEDFLQTTPEEDWKKVDAIICNPPYTRHHELGQDYKKHVNKQMEDETGQRISSLSPLYSYFYVHAKQFLKEEGRMTFITPSEFLETNYGRDLKQFLLDNYHLRAFLLYDRDESVFEEAMTTSCISFLERKSDGESNDDELTKFIRVDDWEGQEKVLDAIENGEESDTDWGFINTVRQRDLEPEDNWDDLFDPLEISEDDRLVPLSDIADVDRGIATGKNDFFCLSESERVGTADGFEWEIDEEFLSPLIRSSRSVPHYDYREEDWEQQRNEGEEVWLLYHLNELDFELSNVENEGKNTTIDDYIGSNEPNEDDQENQPKVVEYLWYGMSDEIGAAGSYLAENRHPWYLVDRRDPAPILYTYMSRSHGRFVHNKTGARNLNNLHSIYLDVELDEKELAALLGYLNSEFADTVVKRSGRTYSTGMDKVEPAELEAAPVINPHQLNENVITQLAKLFGELCEASRHGEEDDVRHEIDEVLREELDI